MEAYFHSFSTSVLDEGEWSAPCSRRFVPEKKVHYPLNGSQDIRVKVSNSDLPNKDDDVSRTFGLTEINGNSFTI